MELQIIQNKIYEIRGHRVMLDFDLAEMYQVETKVLKQSVRRNIERFPSDFMFELTKNEYDSLRSQIVTLNDISKKGRGQHSKYLPFVFTEQGVAQLSSVLNSAYAIEVNIKIVRAFITMRQFLIDNASKFKEIEELRNRVKLLEEYNEDILKAVNDLSEDTRSNIDDIYIALSEMAAKQKSIDKPRNPIGFKK